MSRLSIAAANKTATSEWRHATHAVAALGTRASHCLTRLPAMAGHGAAATGERSRRGIPRGVTIRSHAVWCPYGVLTTSRCAQGVPGQSSSSFLRFASHSSAEETNPLTSRCAWALSDPCSAHPTLPGRGSSARAAAAAQRPRVTGPRGIRDWAGATFELLGRRSETANCPSSAMLHEG